MDGQLTVLKFIQHIPRALLVRREVIKYVLKLPLINYEEKAIIYKSIYVLWKRYQILLKYVVFTVP